MATSLRGWQESSARALIARYKVETENLTTITTKQSNVQYIDSALTRDPFLKHWVCRACGTTGLSFKEITTRKQLNHCPSRNYISRRSVRRIPCDKGQFVFLPHTPLDTRVALEVLPLPILQTYYDDIVTRGGCQIVYLYHKLKDMVSLPWVTDRLEEDSQSKLLEQSAPGESEDAFNVVEAYFQCIYPWTAHIKEIEWAKRGTQIIELPHNPSDLIGGKGLRARTTDGMEEEEEEEEDLFDGDDVDAYNDPPIPITFTTSPWVYSTQTDLVVQTKVAFMPFAVINTSHHVVRRDAPLFL